MRARILTPELLDHLAPGDPRAVKSRRDLVRINAVMGQAPAMARLLSDFPAPKLIADLGGGISRPGIVHLSAQGRALDFGRAKHPSLHAWIHRPFAVTPPSSARDLRDPRRQGCWPRRGGVSPWSKRRPFPAAKCAENSSR